MNDNYYKNERLMQNKAMIEQAGYQFCINQGEKAKGNKMNSYDDRICNVKDAIEAINIVKSDNRMMGYVLFLIAIHMFNDGINFEFAADMVRSETQI